MARWFQIACPATTRTQPLGGRGPATTRTQSLGGQWTWASVLPPHALKHGEDARPTRRMNSITGRSIVKNESSHFDGMFVVWVKDPKLLVRPHFWSVPWSIDKIDGKDGAYQESCDLNHMTIPAPFRTLYFFTSKLGKTLYKVIKGISDFLLHFWISCPTFTLYALVWAHPAPVLTHPAPCYIALMPLLSFSTWDEVCAKMSWCHMICLDYSHKVA